MTVTGTVTNAVLTVSVSPSMVSPSPAIFPLVAVCSSCSETVASVLFCPGEGLAAGGAFRPDCASAEENNGVGKTISAVTKRAKIVFKKNLSITATALDDGEGIHSFIINFEGNFRVFVA